MVGPGWSAQQQYRASSRRRRRVRAVTALAAVVAAAAGGWLAVSGHAFTGRPVELWSVRIGWLRWVAGAAWGAAAAALSLLAWPRYGGRDVGRWRRGAEGERRTGDLLDTLPPGRFVVRHDLRVPGSRANVDHVVIGRTGVWVIDTKATRAPVTARWRRVHFGDRRLDTASVRWEAEVVADRLVAGADGAPPAGDRGRLVRPIVAVHGDGLRRRGGRAGGVRVVPAAELTRRLWKGRRRLRRAEIQALGAVLDRAFPPRGAVAGAARDQPVVRRLRSWGPISEGSSHA